mgnify:CR=1 FL=1
MICYVLSHVGRIWACSDFVARTCMRYPEVFHELLADINSSQSRSDYRCLVEKTLAVQYDEIELMRALRRLRQKEMLRIAWRDLDELASQKQILNELSDLAEAIVSVTLEYLYQQRIKVFGYPVDDDNDKPQKMLVLIKLVLKI